MVTFASIFINNITDADSFHEWLLGYDVRDYEINDKKSYKKSYPIKNGES